MRYLYILCFTIFISNSVNGQVFIDSCFITGGVGIDFINGAGIYNTGEESADIVIWNGYEWINGWDHALISASLPPGKSGCDCRAVWIGNGTSWTTNGEGVALKLKDALVEGKEYSIDFTYISNGEGSDGFFGPFVYSTDDTSSPNKFFIDTLPDVGHSWATNTLSFIADSIQNGHNWINIQTIPGEGSGLISSFCNVCPCRGFIEMPNVFSPNGDGVNDIFKATLFQNINSFEFKVYNRWGQLLREDKSGIPDWNGKVDFEIVPDGVYYWIINYKDFKNDKYVLTGFLHLTK